MHDNSYGEIYMLIYIKTIHRFVAVGSQSFEYQPTIFKDL